MMHRLLFLVLFLVLSTTLSPAQTAEIRFDDEALTEKFGALRDLLLRESLEADDLRRAALGLRAFYVLAPEGDRLLPLPGRTDLAISPREAALRLALSLPDPVLNELIAIDERAAAPRQQAGHRDRDLAARFPLAPTGRAARWRLALRALEQGEGGAALFHLDALDLAEARGPADSVASAPGRESARALALIALGDRPALRAFAAESASRRVDTPEDSRSAGVRAIRAEAKRESLALGPLANDPAWIANWPRDDDLPGALVPQFWVDRLIAHDPQGVRAIAVATGKTLWERTWDDIGTVPAPSGDYGHDAFAGVIADGVYVLAVRDDDEEEGDSALLGLDAASGETRWVRRHADEEPETTEDDPDAPERGSLLWDPAPSARDGVLVATATDRSALPSTWIIALEASTGRVRWSRKIRSNVPFEWKEPSDGCTLRPRSRGASSAFAGHFLVVADHRGQVIVLRPDQGAALMRWTYPRRGAGQSLGARGARAPGWRHAPILTEGRRFAVAPSDASAAFCLTASPARDAASLRRGEALVLYETLARRGGRRLEGLSAGSLVVSAADRDLELEVLRAHRPFSDLPSAANWVAPVPLDGPIWASADSRGKNVYVGTERYVYQVVRDTGRSGDPLLRLGDALRGPGALEVLPTGLLVSSRTACGLFRPTR